MNLHERWSAIAGRVSAATGSVWAFFLALMAIAVWVITGPIFGFSDTWQLVINTGTTIVTFLMVFLIQHAQNKDVRALHLKLDELLAAVEGASNKMIDVEERPDREIKELDEHYRELARVATRKKD